MDDGRTDGRTVKAGGGRLSEWNDGSKVERWKNDVVDIAVDGRGRTRTDADTLKNEEKLGAAHVELQKVDSALCVEGFRPVWITIIL